MSGNATKRHDNRAVKAALEPVSFLHHACEEHPWLGPILDGVVWLKSPGDTATRPLRRSLVYHIISMCDVISTEAVHEVTGGRCSAQTAARYAAVARVASKAAAARIRKLSAGAEASGSISNLYKGTVSEPAFT